MDTQPKFNKQRITEAAENIDMEQEASFKVILNDAREFLGTHILPTNMEIHRNPFRFQSLIHMSPQIFFKGGKIIFALQAIVTNSITDSETVLIARELRDLLSMREDHLSKIIVLVQSEMRDVQDEIFNSKIEAEYNTTENEIKQVLQKINEQSGMAPEGDRWNKEKIADMTLDDLVNFTNTYGSGQYFLHSFPKVSIEAGAICSGVGAQQLGGFTAIRGASTGIDINFACGRGDIAEAGFYGTISDFEGNVFFPAEVLLENYAFINLPYAPSRNFTSAEWRIYGPPANANSQLHIVPLNLGVCFFNAKDKKEVNDAISKLPQERKPNKIIFFEEKYPHEALQEFLKRVKPLIELQRELPKLSLPIRHVTNLSTGESVFGTNNVTRVWDSSKA